MSAKFPDVIDNSMRTSWRRCPQHFYHEYILGLRPKGGTSIHLVAGAAFASGLEEARKAFYIHGASPEEAYIHGAKALIEAYGDAECPERYRNKDFDRVFVAYASYWEQWPIDKDPIRVAIIHDKPAIEFSFAIALPINHPVTGNPILYAGRYDWTGEYGESKMNYCIDEKTCSSMGGSWASSWELRAQFMGYVWAAREYGIPVQGTIVRGTCLQLTQIRHAEAIINAKEFLLRRWYAQLLRDVKRMIQEFEEDAFGWDYSDGCTAYGGCTFRDLCSTPDEEPWIKINYERDVKWNPLGVLDA